MNPTIECYAPLLTRVLVSQIFVIAGVGKVADWSGTAGYMASKNMPFVGFFLVMAILFELVGGLAVLIGFRARLGAAALIVFLIPTTLIFHSFWTDPDDQSRMQMIHFMKNLAILGALLMIAAHGPGPISLDAKPRKAPGRAPEPPVIT